LQGNIRDHATLEQLVVLSSLESQNALLIHQQVPVEKRLVMLNDLARAQLTSLMSNNSVKTLRSGPLLP
jgi:hypothetical protein